MDINPKTKGKDQFFLISLCSRCFIAFMSLSVNVQTVIITTSRPSGVACLCRSAVMSLVLKGLSHGIFSYFEHRQNYR